MLLSTYPGTRLPNRIDCRHPLLVLKLGDRAGAIPCERRDRVPVPLRAVRERPPVPEQGRRKLSRGASCCREPSSRRRPEPRSVCSKKCLVNVPNRAAARCASCRHSRRATRRNRTTKAVIQMTASWPVIAWAPSRAGA